jgi:hypothetical protein
MNACRSATFVSEGVNHAAPQLNLDGPQIGATEIFQPFANDFALTAGSFVQMSSTIFSPTTILRVRSSNLIGRANCVQNHEHYCSCSVCRQ